MIIDRLPPFVQRFFSPMASKVSKPQFAHLAHLWSLVLAMAVSRRAAKLVHPSAAAAPAAARS